MPRKTNRGTGCVFYMKPSGSTPYFCRGHSNILLWIISSLSVTGNLQHHQHQTKFRSAQPCPGCCLVTTGLVPPGLVPPPTKDLRAEGSREELEDLQKGPNLAGWNRKEGRGGGERGGKQSPGGWLSVLCVHRSPWGACLECRSPALPHSSDSVDQGGGQSPDYSLLSLGNCDAMQGSHCPPFRGRTWGFRKDCINP